LTGEIGGSGGRIWRGMIRASGGPSLDKWPPVYSKHSKDSSQGRHRSTESGRTRQGRRKLM